MLRPAPYACDVCGHEKQDTNHWFILFPSSNENTIVYAVYTWDDTVAEKQGAKHLCGSDCLAQMQSKLISKLQGAKNVFEEKHDANEVH